jgi:hypothetical protein
MYRGLLADVDIHEVQQPVLEPAYYHYYLGLYRLTVP